MSNELNITQDAGLTLTAKVFTKAGAQQGSTVNMSEVSSGLYSGDFSLTGVADGKYTVLFYDGVTTVGFGELGVYNETEGAEVNANIVKVNNYEIRGDGQRGSEWGPS